MSSTEFNLPGLYITILKHKRVIFLLAFLSAVAGAVFYLVYPKHYEAKTEFVLRNPIYGDRNNIYNTKQLDYFAAEDDVNRLIFMAQSELVQMQVIRNMNLAGCYQVDTTNPKGMFGLKKMFYKNMNIIRTEYQDLVLTYTDNDPTRAANVANECVRVAEIEYNNFFDVMRKKEFDAIKQKTAEEDSAISALTDTLYQLREQYQIYDLMSPARHNIMSASLSVNKGIKGIGMGIEKIQNVEAIKDEIVSDRANKTTLLNEYSTALNGESRFPLVQVITPATPPVNPKGLGGLLTVITCGALGFFFSTIIMLVADNMKDAQTNSSI